MEHLLLMQHRDATLPPLKSTGLLAICVILHLAAVKLGGFHYDLREFLARFGVESLVSIMSGVGSLALAVIMGNYYLLRNKLLRKELKEQKEKEEPEEGE